jgi:hypothetical protein
MIVEVVITLRQAYQGWRLAILTTSEKPCLFMGAKDYTMTITKVKPLAYEDREIFDASHQCFDKKY